MQSRILFRAMLIFAVPVNLALVVLFASEKEDTRLVDSWQSYRSEQGEFSIMYPADWRPQEFTMHDVEFEARFTSPKGARLSAIASLSGSIMMDLLKLGRVAKDPLSEYHERFMSDLEEILGNFQRSETAKMTVGNMEAFGTSFEFRTWNGLMGRTMKGMIVSTWNGDHHIVLMFVCPAKQYNETFAVFGTFLDSFKPDRVRVEE